MIWTHRVSRFFFFIFFFFNHLILLWCFNGNAALNLFPFVPSTHLSYIFFFSSLSSFFTPRFSMAYIYSYMRLNFSFDTSCLIPVVLAIIANKMYKTFERKRTSYAHKNCIHSLVFCSNKNQQEKSYIYIYKSSIPCIVCAPHAFVYWKRKISV